MPVSCPPPVDTTFIFLLHHSACESLSFLQNQTELPSMEAWSPHHWTVREFLKDTYLNELGNK